jgi:hypothetical protein
MVMHMTKGTGTKAIYRASGTLAFVAASRVAWLVIRDPADKDRRLMLPAKCNIIQRPTGLAYRIRDGVIQWEATPIDKTADEALADEGKNSERKGARGPIPEKCRAVMELVRQYLAKGAERHGATRQYIESKGFTSSTFYRALDELEAVKFEDDMGKKWIRLKPGTEPEEPDAPAGDGPEILPFDDGKPF